MPYKDLPVGTTHSYNDGCGCPEHNDMIDPTQETPEAPNVGALSTQDINVNDPNRIWIFVAYKSDEYGSVPIFSKLFNNHTELKIFSGNHSAEWKEKVQGYHSDYLDLTDRSFLTLQQERQKKEMREVLEELDKILARYSEDRPIPPSILRRFQEDIINKKIQNLT